MSSSDRGRSDIPGLRPDLTPSAKTPGPADAADPYANWLDRMQKARARHAAITKNLYTWSNYKNWADRMKDSFEDEPSAKPDGNGVRSPRRSNAELTLPLTVAWQQLPHAPTIAGVGVACADSRGVEGLSSHCTSGSHCSTSSRAM